jgi:hypothetical protein
MMFPENFLSVEIFLEWKCALFKVRPGNMHEMAVVIIRAQDLTSSGLDA